MNTFNETLKPQTPVLVEDRWQTLDMARAAARCLRAQGWDAKVESNAGEHRVCVERDGMVAYFYEGDKLDAFEPHWI